jgi:predicted dehydrogenase
MPAQPPIRFAAIGLNHNHIYAQVNLLLRAGAELVAYYAPEPELRAEFERAFPQAQLAPSVEAVLEDDQLQLIVTAAIPAERAPLGLLAMQHGKDFMSDKPAFTTLDQLAEARRVQAATGRIYSVCFSERFESRATVRAAELARAGALGQVLQTVGLGPHRANLHLRPEWFFRRAAYGGILTDIGSHQVDQFLHFTGATAAEVVTAQVANRQHPHYPELEDFGELLLRSPAATGYIRVDWFTPDGLETWGDGRLFVLGSQGYLEVRKYVDLAGRPGGDHLFWADRAGTHYEDCRAGDLPYGPQLLADIRQRTQTAMPQAHCFLACELALRAQAQAVRLGYLHADQVGAVN